jgi:probable F420-dependent oxidoreductase
MKIGVFATFMSPQATPDMIQDFGRRIEAIGIHSIWMGEHVVLFDDMEFPYPGSKDGKVPVPEGGGLLDTVATFGFLAAATRDVRLGTGVTLVPQRNPIYTAKEFATLDWLTNGRVDFGVGVGWCKEEVLACGYSWADRGARCDEFLEVMKALWTQPTASYSGLHISLAPCRMDPKPVQTPHVPIVIGGHSKRALRRAAEHGDAWYGFRLDPDETRALVDMLDSALTRAGRTREGFDIIVTPKVVDAQTLSAFARAGVDQLVVQLGSQRAHRIDQRIPELAEIVNMAGQL